MSLEHNNRFGSPLRYPGGKGSLTNFMKLVMQENNLLDCHYVEVYAGGAGIAWKLMLDEYVQQVHINDVNKALIAFWKSILETTDELCRLIVDTPITVEEWYKQRNIQNNPHQYSQLEIGFSTFFLNRTNRSGILKGGIIGGKEQAGRWKIDARFKKSDLIARIQRIAKYADRVQVYNLDAAKFIKTILPSLPTNTLIYLDPPYYNKGQDLYENRYTPKEHGKIAKLVSAITQPWLVSYDGCPEVANLYKDYESIYYHINYSARNRYAGSEVIFFSPNLTVPAIANPTAVR